MENEENIDRYVKIDLIIPHYSEVPSNVVLSPDGVYSRLPFYSDPLQVIHDNYKFIKVGFTVNFSCSSSILPEFIFHLNDFILDQIIRYLNYHQRFPKEIQNGK